MNNRDSYTKSVKFSLWYLILNIYFKSKFKLGLIYKSKDLSIRKSSAPYLCSDTYYQICEFRIDSEDDLHNLIKMNGDFDLIYIQGHLINKLQHSIKSIKPSSIRKLIIMESDNTQFAHELVPILKIATFIYTNNLLGRADHIYPIPLGLERQCYRSAGVLADFKKPFGADSAKRNIGFLVAWNDETNASREIYRQQFKESPNSLIIESRVSPQVIHKLMRRTLFVPSPAGNGLDCHRTWEALYLGAVPVILEKDFCGDQSWPVLVVPTWNDLIEKDLDELQQIYKQNIHTYEQALIFSTQFIERIRTA